MGLDNAALYYFPYRYHSPSMNRWTSADPARLTDRMCMTIQVLECERMCDVYMQTQSGKRPQSSKERVIGSCGKGYNREETLPNDIVFALLCYGILCWYDKKKQNNIKNNGG